MSHFNRRYFAGRASAQGYRGLSNEVLLGRLHVPHGKRIPANEFAADIRENALKRVHERISPSLAFSQFPQDFRRRIHSVAMASHGV